jgi:hypothetical protein
MKEEMSIDELLNSFVDGELTSKQENEVRRLIDNDPQIAQRLLRLQKCKVLISSLPVAKAPVGMLDDTRVSLKDKTLQKRLLASQKSTVARKLLSQRTIAAAAMIGFAVLLTALVLTIAPPETVPEGYDIASGTPFVADVGFGGRLDIKTDDLDGVDSFINRTLENNGFTDSLRPVRETNKRVYSIVCSKKGLDRLLVDFKNIWNKLDSVTLYVNTGEFNELVAVNEVTTDQIARIADQQSTMGVIEVAKDFAILNQMAAHLPGREIFSSIDDQIGGAVTLPPKPVLTKKKVEQQDVSDDGEKNIHLTIVINR